ncbi:hypothetical protein HYQ44_010414 [Verticillium longisporum]|nr:hypothetical protein HYQ44_010414 [Verticillium longisporum]
MFAKSLICFAKRTALSPVERRNVNVYLAHPRPRSLPKGLDRGERITRWDSSLKIRLISPTKPQTLEESFTALRARNPLMPR